MNMTNPNVPSFVPDGMDIMVKKDKVALNALSIPHIGSLALDLDMGPPVISARGKDFFISGRGTNKKDSGRRIIFESQGMGREGVKKFFCRWWFLEKSPYKKEKSLKTGWFFYGRGRG